MEILQRAILNASKKTYLWIALGIFSGLLVIPYVLPKSRDVACDRLTTELSGQTDLISCFKDRGHRRWYRSSVTSVKPPAYNVTQINPAAFPTGVMIETFSDTITPTVVGRRGEDVKSIGGFTSTGDGMNIVVSALISPEELQQGVKIAPYFLNGGNISFRLIPVDWRGKESTPFLTGGVNGGSSYWFWAVTIVGAIVILLCMLQFRVKFQRRWAFVALSAGFILAYQNFELTYRDMGGFFDTGDDTYYVAAVQRLIQFGSFFKCDVPVHVGFYANRDLDRCVAPPGVPASMVPGLLIRSYMRGTSPWGRELGLTELQAMRLNMAFYGFMATVILFLVLSRLVQSSLAIALGAAILWGTSLSKWTFERSLFTHATELFLWPVILLCLTGMFLSQSKRRTYIALTGLALGLQIFVRGEYFLLLLSIPAYLYFSSPKLERSWRRLGVDLAIFAVCFAPFLLVYRRVVATVGAYAKGTGALILKSPQDLVDPEFYAKLWASFSSVIASFADAGGLVFFGFGILAYRAFRPKTDLDRIAKPLLFTFTVFFIFTTLFHTPLGMEWQHRYFLKLYPICFIAIALAYRSRGPLFKAITWLILGASLVREYYIVIHQGPMQSIYESWRDFMSDSHLLVHGYDGRYYVTYTLALSLFAISGAILIGCEWHARRQKIRLIA